MRRGMQGHVAAPRGPTRRLRGALCTYIYIVYLIYSKVSLPYIGRVFEPLRPLLLINPMIPSHFYRVGLCSPRLSLFQATWLTEKHWIRNAMKIARRCGGHEVHPIFDQRTCLKSHLSEALQLISTVRQPSYNSRD